MNAHEAEEVDVRETSTAALHVRPTRSTIRMRRLIAVVADTTAALLAWATSGFNELALVGNADVEPNTGSAYPKTPGPFDDFSFAS
jgi:hypothetical protein